MEEDDMDFIPSSNTSSNLASLFGFTKKPLQGNASLTYTAPKAPKGESNVAKKSTEEKTKSKIIYSKAIHAYKLEKRTYISQGLIGIVISGNHESRIYEIILYKRNKEHLCQIRISNDFIITLSSNNYVSFYDNNRQNWSLMFQSAGDVEQFSQKVAICKFYSYPESPEEPLIQDLSPPSQPKASFKSTVDVVYSSYALIPEEISKLKEDIKSTIVLYNCSFLHFSKSLVGCAENCKRIIIIPHSLGGPWLSELNPNKDLMLEVKLERILPEEENLITESKGSKEKAESPIDSSTEETVIKSKGASVKEALSSTKSQKANLISRMARMGQATLPVKPGLSAGPSDSEEENSLTSSPKPRIPRSRVAASNAALNASQPQTSQCEEISQQVSVYQNDLSWHPPQLGKPSVMYQQLVPVSASPMPSPSADPNLSVFLSESRIQAAELRMGMSKISEKMDLIWNKVQNMSGTSPDVKIQQMALMDSVGILSSIQNLITENESLKGKVEEQKEKIEQQNDRIFHLLELNHKYLEQNSTSHEKQSASESRLKAEMESLQKKEGELELSNRKAFDKVKTLTEDLVKSEERNSELKKRVEELNAEIGISKKNIEENNESKKELKILKEKLTKAAETITTAEEKLKEVVSENDTLKSLINVQKEEIEKVNEKIIKSEAKKKEYEEAIEILQKKIVEEEKRTESKIDCLLKKVSKLEDENKCLLEKFENQRDQGNTDTVLPLVLAALKNHFLGSEEYSSSYILTSIEEIFNRTTDGSSVLSEKREAPIPETSRAKHDVVPAPRKSVQKIETSVKEKEEENVVKDESKEEQVKNVKETKDVEAIKAEETEIIQKSDVKESTQEVKAKETQKEEEMKKSKEPKGTNETVEAKESCLLLESESKEEKNQSEDKKKKEEVDSRYKSYDQGWRTTKPPPPPLFDDEDDLDDWLI